MILLKFFPALGSSSRQSPSLPSAGTLDVCRDPFWLAVNRDAKFCSTPKVGAQFRTDKRGVGHFGTQSLHNVELGLIQKCIRASSVTTKMTQTSGTVVCRNPVLSTLVEKTSQMGTRSPKWLLGWGWGTQLLLPSLHLQKISYGEACNRSALVPVTQQRCLSERPRERTLLHIRILPVSQGCMGLLDSQGGCPAQNIGRAPWLVVGSCLQKGEKHT